MNLVSLHHREVESQDRTELLREHTIEAMDCEYSIRGNNQYQYKLEG